MKKYFLQIEIRYSIPINENIDENEYQQTCFNRFTHSPLFDNEKECIDYGNKLIMENLWIEQYPGYVGNRLERRFGYPLVTPRLKNGAQIFISVKSLNIADFEDMNSELRMFNIDKITKKL